MRRDVLTVTEVLSSRHSRVRVDTSLATTSENNVSDSIYNVGDHVILKWEDSETVDQISIKLGPISPSGLTFGPFGPTSPYLALRNFHWASTATSLVHPSSSASDHGERYAFSFVSWCQRADQGADSGPPWN